MLAFEKLDAVLKVISEDLTIATPPDIYAVCANKHPNLNISSLDIAKILEKLLIDGHITRSDGAFLTIRYLTTWNGEIFLENGAYSGNKGSK